MKESVGALGLTNIVIVFILLFSGYLCISVNQTKAYNVKNEMLNIIHKHNGLDSSTLEEIREYMNTVGYRSTGKCDNEDDGVGYTINSESQDKATFCIKTVNVNSNMSDKYNQFPSVKYYKVKVFFSLDIPIIGKMFNFNLIGTSKNIYYPVEDGV